MKQSSRLRERHFAHIRADSFQATGGGSLFEVEMDTKYCPGCEDDRPVKEFSKNKAKKDGLCSQCKSCEATRNREYNHTYQVERASYRQAHRPEINASTRAYRLRHPLPQKARRAIRYAIETGKIIRPDRCSNPECNKLCKPEAHHYLGYAKEHWLDVVFLCADCHVIADREDRQAQLTLES